MTEERMASLRGLAQQLDGGFQDLALLDNALIHRSFVNENPLPAVPDNERLEFLGDAVLELCISDMLMKKFPAYTEGQLSKLRASVVNEQPLAGLARRFGLGDYLLLGKGEEISGGREKNSLLANTLEAVIASLYLDRGFDKTLIFVGRLFAPLIAAGTQELIYRDYKTTLQETVQNRFKEIPQYALVGEYGPDHNKLFEIRLTVNGLLDTCGTGKNKKEAEQQAARKALEKLDESIMLSNNDVPGKT
ncbi:MAG: ribonuclease III [Deltaproteobacteria bacterium]|nr:ribonuclease III [Deltaproteobacteria bacterium]